VAWDAPDEDSHGGEPAPVEVPIEAALDLHSFAPRDIPGVVVSYLEAARERGLVEVRLIHGKGTGFQRERVRDTLALLDSVQAYADAPAGRGHWGATIVQLRPREERAAQA